MRTAICMQTAVCAIAVCKRAPISKWAAARVTGVFKRAADVTAAVLLLNKNFNTALLFRASRAVAVLLGANGVSPVDFLLFSSFSFAVLLRPKSSIVVILRRATGFRAAIHVRTTGYCAAAL